MTLIGYHRKSGKKSLFRIKQFLGTFEQSDGTLAFSATYLRPNRLKTIIQIRFQIISLVVRPIATRWRGNQPELTCSYIFQNHLTSNSSATTSCVYSYSVTSSATSSCTSTAASRIADTVPVASRRYPTPNSSNTRLCNTSSSTWPPTWRSAPTSWTTTRSTDLGLPPHGRAWGLAAADVS